jgi:hypothetical protein
MSIRSPLQRSSPRRHAILRAPVVWLAAFLLLVAAGLPALEGHAREDVLPHQSVHSTPSMTAVVDRDAADRLDHGGRDHQHTGDDLVDLLTFGHCHTGGTSSGVLPESLRLDLTALVERPLALLRDRAVLQRTPSNPFRPPIA